MIKRYNINASCECGRFKPEVDASEDPEGDWVKYEDLKKIIEHHNEQEKK